MHKVELLSEREYIIHIIYLTAVFGNKWSLGSSLCSKIVFAFSLILWHYCTCVLSLLVLELLDTCMNEMLLRNKKWLDSRSKLKLK